MFEIQKDQLIKAGIKLDRYGLIALSGGNLSFRLPSGEILMTPSGMIYEELVTNDIVVMDIEGTIIEGSRRPSVDNEAIRYIFKKRPDVNAIIHTHQPFATALGLVQDEVPCNLTTLANAVRGSVKVAPYSSAASIEMGIETIENLGNQLAVILKHHGVITIGDTLDQALYACIYLEEACKTIIYAMSTQKEMSSLTQTQIENAVEIFKNYGQKKKETPNR